MGRYPSDVGIVNGGWMDGWNTAREPGFGMAYFDRTDLPFYYAMADAWTIGDQYAAPFPQCIFATSCALPPVYFCNILRRYFQSALTATNPNRQFLFSGRNCDGNAPPSLIVFL